MGAVLEPILDGTLEAPTNSGVTWQIRGTRNGRNVRVELNEMHGVFEVACAVKELPIGYVRIHEESSIFAGDTPYIVERLKISVRGDEVALWGLLPDMTRMTLVDMLGSPSSSLSLDTKELAMMLGPLAILRDANAADVIVQQLDRMLALAAVIEDYWNVDPTMVGTGRSTHVPKPRPEPPRRLVLVEARDAHDIAARALPARDAMLARLAADRIEPFPAANPLHDRARVKGRVVVLPAVAPNAWVSDSIHKVIVAGDTERGWYFASTNDAGFQRVQRAVERYERATGTKLGDAPYEVIGEITGNPSMVVVAARSAQIGLEIAVLGMLIGDRVFVDAATLEGSDSLFAGERG